jgi:hypothetical protein
VIGWGKTHPATSPSLKPPRHVDEPQRRNLKDGIGEKNDLAKMNPVKADGLHQKQNRSTAEASSILLANTSISS